MRYHDDQERYVAAQQLFLSGPASPGGKPDQGQQSGQRSGRFLRKQRCLEEQQGRDGNATQFLLPTLVGEECKEKEETTEQVRSPRDPEDVFDMVRMEREEQSG